MLRSEVEELGVMAIFRQNKPEVIPFDPSEQHLLSTIGELAGNALRRLLLFERAELRLHQTQALRKIDPAITSNLDLQSVLEVALDQIVAQLGVDAAVVLMVNHETQWLVCAAHRGFLSEKVVPEACSLDGTYTPVVGDRSIIHFSHWDENGTTNHRLAFVAGEKFVEYWAIPLVIKDEVIGILELFNRSGMNVDEEWIEFFNTLTGQVAIAIDNIELFNHLQQANISLEQAYDSTIEGWSRALDLRDRETEGHTLRVTELAIKLAQMVGMEKEEIVHLRRGALLHDMGKLAIPDSILLKPGKLTDEEWEIMRKHSTFACDMLANIEYLRPALDVPCHHHEKWDGSGYPEGLKGEEIPLAARVFAVADVWDALCSDRPYRPAWKREDVRGYIRSVSGTHFDPAVVDAFFEFLRTTD